MTAITRRKPTIALSLSFIGIIIPLASRIGWVTTALSRHRPSYFKQQRHPWCPLSTLRRSGTPPPSPSSTAFKSVGGVNAAVPSRSFLHRSSPKMATSDRSNDVTCTDGVVPFLHSSPSILSEWVNNNADAPANNSKTTSTVRIVMGNEAGDADSIISALSLGYVESAAATREGKGETVVPIVGIPRADISLRRDVVLLLDLVGVPPEKLLYLDDDAVARSLLQPLDHDDARPSSTRTLTLVDHNRIRSSLSHLSSLVTEIVDHHEDEHSHEDVTADSGKRVIAFDKGVATVASTCTLVAERIFRYIDQSPSSNLLDGSLGLMLLSVILLDSVNMLPAAGKGTERDEEAIQTLLKRTDWSTCGSVTPSLVDAAALEKIFPNGRSAMPDRTELFNMLSNAKNDPQFWAALSVNDCLRIDYKMFPVPGKSPLVSSIGLSSVLLDMDSLLGKENFLEELGAFMSSSDTGVFGILALKFRDGKPNRELLLAGSDVKVVDSFTNFLTNHPDAAYLEIVERKECLNKQGQADHNLFIRVFRQGNSKGSRKQVAPILIGHASDEK